MWRLEDCGKGLAAEPAGGVHGVPWEDVGVLRGPGDALGGGGVGVWVGDGDVGTGDTLLLLGESE